MSLVPVAARNRVNPGIPSVATIEETNTPYVTYDEVELCADPNCPVCRAQRRDKRHKHKHKHHHKTHHHQHHHHRKTTDFWSRFLPRTESARSAVSIHSVELDVRRPRDGSYVTERSLVPVNQTERQIVSTTRTTGTRRLPEETVAREAWTPQYQSADDEIVCCRAYDGCRCPCWCCIILIILFVILLIIMIILLATLL